MAAVAMAGVVALPLILMLMRRLTDFSSMPGVAVEALVGAVLGAGIMAALGGFRAAGSYKRHSSLLVVGGGNGPERLGAILHELGYRMQEIIPGLVEREREFLEGKLGRPIKVYPPWKAFALRAIGVGYSSDARNVSRFGVYRPYTALDPLVGHAYEVFTTGLEGMEYGAINPWTKLFDPELRPFGDHQEFVRRCIQEL
jgi:hypothetical protein